MKIIFKIAQSACFFLFSFFCFALFLLPALAMRIKRSCSKRPAKPEYVFVGIHEIANNISELSAALAKQHITVRSARSHAGVFYGETDAQGASALALKIRLFSEPLCRSRHLPWILLRADQAWFIWCTSLLALNLDYILYRLAGVDLVVQHCGDDVRCRHLHDALFEKYTPGIAIGSYPALPLVDMLRKYYRQFMAERFAKTISSRNQATFQTGMLGHFTFSQTSLLTGPRRPGEIPVLVHAPSNRAVKRTDLVLEAVETLRQKGYAFEFHLLEHIPNHQVVSMLLAADIVVDQPATWPGRFGIEGAAASCAIVSGNYDVFTGLPASPIIQFPVDANLLASCLEKLLADRAYLESVMAACWGFWKEKYSEEAFIKNYFKIWNNQHDTFPPLPEQKAILLAAAKGKLQRLFIKYFYFPSNQDNR